MELSLKTEKRKKIIGGIKNTALVVIGTCIVAFGIGLFLIPFDLVTGGIPGISIVVKECLSGIEFFRNLPVSTYASVINWCLFFVGLIILGKKFALKTLVSTLVYPFALSFFELLGTTDAFGGFFNLLSERYAEYGDIARIVATVLAGACIGCGCALTFRGGGSTGGLDIVALVTCKYIRKLKPSQVLFTCDTTIIILGMFVMQNLLMSLLGIISAFICSMTINKIFASGQSAVSAHIVSDKYKEINSAIITKMNRTCTVLDCKGGYTGDNKKLLITTFTLRQYGEFTAIVNSIDKEAFITVHRAQEINGEGWSYNIEKTVKNKDFVQKELD